MNDRFPAGHRPSPTRFLPAAALLLFFAGHAGASDGGPRLEIYYGPNETDQLTLFAVEARLDGRPISLEKPAHASGARQKIFEGPLAAGAHKLQVTVALAGDNSVFVYVRDYRFDMNGTLEFASAEGGTVEATARIKNRRDPSVEWYDKYALDLSAVQNGSPSGTMITDGRAEPPPASPTAQTDPAAPPPPPSPLPVVAESPPPAPVQDPPPPPPLTPPAACALEPPHFEFNLAALSPQGQAALDRFATCLAASSVTVTLVGHCDQRGDDAVNQWIGKERAEAAARYLEARGVAPARIRVESKGAGQPLCAEATAECFARNRRVGAIVGGAPR